MHAFTAPPLENFHENRKLEQGISKTVNEMKLASNWFKRYLSIKSLLTYQFSDFLNFKYPAFTTMILFPSSLYLIFFSLFSYILILMFCFIAYFNPSLNPYIEKFLLKIFINQRRINRDHIEPKHLSVNWIWKYKYAEIESIEGKGKYEKKTTKTLGQSYQQIIEASSRIP